MLHPNWQKEKVELFQLNGDSTENISCPIGEGNFGVGNENQFDQRWKDWFQKNKRWVLSCPMKSFSLSSVNKSE